MKRILSLLLILAISITALASCGLISIFGEVEDEGEAWVVVEAADGSYEVYKAALKDVENKKEGAKGVLLYLRDREENPLHLVMDESSFVTEIGSIKQDVSSGAYVMIYTSVKADEMPGMPTVEYDGNTLYSSNFGITGMTVKADTVILFRLEVFA